MRTIKFNLFGYRFVTMIDQDDNFGDLVATIDIREKGTRVSIHDHINPKAELLAYKHSEEYSKEWLKMGNLSDEKYRELDSLIRYNIQNNIELPASTAISKFINTDDKKEDDISNDYR